MVAAPRTDLGGENEDCDLDGKLGNILHNGTISQETPTTNNNNTSVLQRCFPPNELQGRRIRLYRNGDRFFKGIWYTIIPSLRSWSAFLEDLHKIHYFNGSISLPQGVRFIFNVSGEMCSNLEGLKHGESYVVSSTDKFKRIDYANAAQPMWSFVSSKLSEPPKYGLRETFTREPNDFVKPRIITIIRNGIKPRRVVRHLLNKRTAQSFDMVISDITATIKLNTGVVRKLYSISGKHVNTLLDFFGEDFIFIAYGTERISLDDFYVISEEYKRMEINKKNPKLSGQFRLRPTQLKMLSKRNDREKSSSFNRECSVSHIDDVELPGELKGNVKLIEVLGDGNTALVYKAAFRGVDGQWSYDALKVVLAETLQNEEVLSFVQSEVELLGTLEHEQIVALRDCQILGGAWYIRMELVQDGDLFELLRKRRTLSETEAASCAQTLCQALDYLHRQHMIVHRDVKLENLLIYSRDNERLMVKLADFGLACRLENNDQLLYQLCGTPTYVAPEVLAEFGYSFKADCWSVGIIVFILLCGFPPFGVDESDEVLFNRILRGQFSFPSPSFDLVSHSAKLLIARLLSTDPNSRLSAAEVIDDHWTKSLGECDPQMEIEAEEHLANAMADMDFVEEDGHQHDGQEGDADDFAVSESSAEFFFSRRASMDELSEPGTSMMDRGNEAASVVEATVRDMREMALQKRIQMAVEEMDEAEPNGQANPVGKETPRAARRGTVMAAKRNGGVR